MHRGWLDGGGWRVEDGASVRGNGLSEGVAVSVLFITLSVPGMVPGTYQCSTAEELGNK